MKTLFPSRFGHDHYADRAQVLLLANANYNEMPKHVKAVDVVGETPEKLLSIKDAREFYILMEEAGGRPYFEDMNNILTRGRLGIRDVERAEMLADFLAEIHSIKYQGEDADILYKRRIRDLIGHGECIMGVIDAFGPLEFMIESDFVAYVIKCIPWWGRLRFKSNRLSSIHGDYHPGNIRLRGDDFILLDRSRGSWGEPADDVSCLGINYIYYAIKDRGCFEGSFADLFKYFLEHYIVKTGDEGIFEVCQPFFAFRSLVIANPRFYPEDSPVTRRKLLNFGYNKEDLTLLMKKMGRQYISIYMPAQRKGYGKENSIRFKNCLKEVEGLLKDIGKDTEAKNFTGLAESLIDDDIFWRTSGHFSWPGCIRPFGGALK